MKGGNSDTIPLNPNNIDLQMGENTRNIPQPTYTPMKRGGGISKRKSKKMKGGSVGLLGHISNNVSDFLYGNTSNPVVNFGTSTGSVFTQQLLTNSSSASNLVNNQPAMSFFNSYNKPLI